MNAFQILKDFPPPEGYVHVKFGTINNRTDKVFNHDNKSWGINTKESEYAVGTNIKDYTCVVRKVVVVQVPDFIQLELQRLKRKHILLDSDYIQKQELLVELQEKVKQYDPNNLSDELESQFQLYRISNLNSISSQLERDRKQILQSERVLRWVGKRVSDNTRILFDRISLHHINIVYGEEKPVTCEKLMTREEWCEYKASVYDDEIEQIEECIRITDAFSSVKFAPEPDQVDK